MKNFIALFFITAFLGGSLSAQVDYPSQPAKGYYETLKKQILPLVPSKTKLLEAKAETIPSGMKDTLLKYDWYEIGGVNFVDSSYTTYWPADLNENEKKYANNQFNFVRYTPKAIIYQMFMNRMKDGSIQIKTTTFDTTTAGKLAEVKYSTPKSGKKPATKNMLVSVYYGEKDPQEILSYKNGILIMCVRQTPNTKTKKFHTAYFAVAKSF